MYRAYQPLLPAANRYLQEKWDKASYQEHCRKKCQGGLNHQTLTLGLRKLDLDENFKCQKNIFQDELSKLLQLSQGMAQRVELAVPVINTKAPPTHLHLQVNLKKLQLERERQAVRDQESRLHSAKLWRIKQSQGRVDNWNFYCIHSLNWGKRQRDLARIYWENQELAKRLEGRRSELAQEHWQQDWHKEQLIRSSIARYPRGTVSCQARNGRRRQATQNNHIPVSVSGRMNPSRTRETFSSKNHSIMGKSFRGSGSESTQEEEITTTTCSPSSLGKRDVLSQSEALARQLSKGTSLLAKTASGGFCPRHADGSLVRVDLAGGGSLEKPRDEAMMISSKPRTSVRLRGNTRPLETSLMPASGDLEKKAAFSSTKNI